jgi:HK97 family phage major capsid protein
VNPYLSRLLAQHDELRTSIESIQTAAATAPATTEGGPAGRDLNESELRSIEGMTEQANKLVPQIDALTKTELRNREVATAAAAVAEATKPVEQAEGEQTRTAGEPVKGERLTGDAQTKSRDPGHYRSLKQGGQHSFFADMFRAQQGYTDASTRLSEHHRALDTTNEGPGLVPPNWMTEEFQAYAYQGRRLSAAVRQVPLGDDPRPITMPRQSASTAAVVGAQSAENDAVTSTDAYDTTTTVVTPVPVTGAQIFSRQMLDMATPAIDGLIYGDLLANHSEKVEARVVAACITAAGSAVTTYATEAAWTTALDPAEATYIGDELIDLLLAVRNARKLPADVLVTAVNRYGSLLKIKDSTGRPVIPADSGGPMNVMGTGTVDVDGRVHGVGLIASDGITQYAESILALRAADVLNFESNVLRFRYEEVSGPESIKIGVWGYQATHVKYSGDSVKRIVITAAS